jgi:hypothetical protein
LKKSLFLAGSAAVLLVGGYLWHQQSTIGELKASQVVVQGPIVVKHELVAELATLRSYTEPKHFAIPRVVDGYIWGHYTSEVVTFDLSAKVLIGYKNIQVTTIQDGNDLTIQATLGEPQLLAFEPTITPVKFEENGWVQAFEFGRTSDAGDFITGKHNEAAAALKKRLSAPGSPLLATAADGVKEALQRIFPQASRIVIR